MEHIESILLRSNPNDWTPEYMVNVGRSCMPDINFTELHTMTYSALTNTLVPEGRPTRYSRKAVLLLDDWDNFKTKIKKAFDKPRSPKRALSEAPAAHSPILNSSQEQQTSTNPTPTPPPGIGMQDDLVTDPEQLSPRNKMSPSTGRQFGNNGAKKRQYSKFQRFEDTYASMQPNQMWTLSTGKVVEKQLFEYGLTQGDEHLCHSFIMDPRDQSYVQDGVFTEEELQEMATFHLSDTGSLPIRLKNYLKKFDVDTVQKFRAVLYAPQPWQNDFNPATSFEFDWIHQTFLHFARLWENTGPKREYRNSWDSNRDWKFIRDIFDNLPFAGFIIKPHDEQDLASSSEHHWLDSRMIYRYSDEAAYQDPTMLSRNLKSMKDMFSRMNALLRHDIHALHRLETVGIFTSGFSLDVVRLDCPAGYVCRVATLSNHVDISQSFRPFIKSIIKCLILIWLAKAVVMKSCQTLSQYLAPSFGNDWIDQCAAYTGPFPFKSSSTSCLVLPPSFTDQAPNHGKHPRRL